jgi:hypothetical protein
MNFIKDLFDKKEGDTLHLQFQKFSRGEFRDRALIKAKRSGEKYTINTSAEFANELVRKLAEKLGKNKTRVTGAIVCTADLKGQLEFKEVKQFQGVKRYLIDSEMSGEEILSLLDKFSKNFFALSFSFGDNILKIKPKAPKSSKPKNKEKGPKADFCKLITKDKEWAESFVFENPNFKEANINHAFLIEKLILPEGEKDFAKIRELAKRKGRIIRTANIDGKEIKKEIEFEA